MNNEFLVSGVKGGSEKTTLRDSGLFARPVDRGAPYGSRGSIFLLLAFEDRKLKRFEAFKWVDSRFLGFTLADELAVPGDVYSSISVARSVGKLSDGPARNVKLQSSAQRHNHGLDPSQCYALAKLLVQTVNRMSGALPY
jgi:hypothetical protein